MTTMAGLPAGRVSACLLISPKEKFHDSEWKVKHFIQRIIGILWQRRCSLISEGQRRVSPIVLD